MRDQRGRGRRRPSHPDPNQKTFTPRKSENEGIQRIPKRTRAPGLAPSFSLAEKLALARKTSRADPDEHSQTDILTSGVETSSPPSRLLPNQWLNPAAERLLRPRVGACSPLQWRNRPRISRGSRTPGCVVGGLFVRHCFKERVLTIRCRALCQEESFYSQTKGW